MRLTRLLLPLPRPACLQLLPDLARRSLVIKDGQQQQQEEQEEQQQARRASEGSPLKQRARWQGVQHYHYTAWPDHGVPDSPTPLLRLCAELRAAGAHAAPILVHCSGGCGLGCGPRAHGVAIWASAN